MLPNRVGLPSAKPAQFFRSSNVAYGDPSAGTFGSAISVLAEIMKVSHGLELLETQGVISTYKYMERLNSDASTTKTKAVKNIVKDLNFRSALVKIANLHENKVEHPKLIELQKIIEKEIKENPDKKIIVFNQYRDNAVDIVEKLNAISNVKATIFVGQMKKGETGLSQKEQKAILGKFREGIFNVLVATSIAEQGLDIPEVDTVIFYEPINKEIYCRGKPIDAGFAGGASIFLSRFLYPCSSLVSRNSSCSTSIYLATPVASWLAFIVFKLSSKSLTRLV